MNIVSVSAIEILDSRGNPTVKAYVTLDNGMTGSAAVPSGASTGVHESVELRDKDDHYLGKGVHHAIQNINALIADEIIGFDINELEKIDEKMIELDGTENKSHLGANAILAVSLACARARAMYHHEPLWKTLHDYYFSHQQTHFPRLMVNVINGGTHADWVFDIQEYMISPRERTPSSAIETSANIFHTLQRLLDKDGYSISVGDEGGFAPELESNEQAFEYLTKAIKEAGYNRDKVDIATDIAASEFYKDGVYKLRKAQGHQGETSYNAFDLSTYLVNLSEAYSILSFEDPFAEDDWSAFSTFTKTAGADHMIVGDDLYVTQSDRIKKGIESKASNAVLIKLNQVGSLLETVQAIKVTREAGWKVIISHRSGETSDSFISDLAVASGADFIKAGSMSRTERLVKYNRLLEIEKIEY